MGITNGRSRQRRVAVGAGLCAAAGVLVALMPGAHAQRPAVTGSSPALHRLYSVPLPSVADGVPAYLPRVATSQGVRNMLFLTTRDGRVLAIDARSGSKLWQRQYGPGSCRINRGNTPCYTTSSPAIDPNGRYIYSYGLDGAVHRLNVGDGTEVRGGGWPETATLKGYDEKGSAALSIATARDGTSYLYVANGGYPGDRGDYQGHLTTINLTTGAQHVFNAACSNQSVHFAEYPAKPDCTHVKTAIWARPGAVYDPGTDRTYISTGNGDFNPAGHAWGESILALHPDGMGANGDPLDSYTPTNYGNLNDRDADLGSSEPVILPMPKGSRYQHVALQAGKDAFLRLVNLDNLSGKGKIGQTGGQIGRLIPVPQGGPVLTQPAIWVDPRDQSVWAFVSDALGTSALRLTIDHGTPRMVAVWKRGYGGSSPIVVNGVLYYAGTSNIWALDPRTGAVRGRDTSIGYIHWQSPLVAGGKVFIADSSAHLSAFVAPGR
ncbi:MAG: hypothetical protein JWO42_2592 [Chloroflexi bacterium]|nr:hypothetical protein [Chloroflexota bacterium]